MWSRAATAAADRLPAHDAPGLAGPGWPKSSRARRRDRAACLAPLAHITASPSGLAYYQAPDSPGWKQHFFLCDFRGTGANSGIVAFTLKPRGASFEVVDPKPFLWSVLATDCEFGPDGALYVSDWVDGWGQTMKGRLYRVFDPATDKSAALQEVRRLLSDGLALRTNVALVGLLGHADRRVRQEAQFALAERAIAYYSRNPRPRLSSSDNPLGVVATAAASATDRFTRLHALWTLWQVGRGR